MKGLRRIETGAPATEHLSRLSLTHRSVQLLGRGAHGTQHHGAAAAAAAGKTAAKTVRGTQRTVGAASSAYRASNTDKDLQEQAHETPNRAIGRPKLKTFGSHRGRQPNVVAPTARGGRGGIRTQRSTSGAVRGGVFAGRNRVKPVRSAGTVGASSSRLAAAAARSAAAAANITRTVIAALATALSSAPVLFITACVLVALIAVLAVIAWLLPGSQQIQLQQEDGGTNLAGSFQLVDDYPYKGKYSEDEMSPLGYAYGNCTDFVAWRINRDAGVSAAPWKYTWKDLTPRGGNGAQWGNLGNLTSWTYTRTPVPGDIVSVRQAGVLGSSTSDIGHVGYVGAVDASGNVTIENYGRGHYFLTKATFAQLGGYIDSGAIAIKHNPAGRVGGIPNGDANGDAKAYALQALGGDTSQFGCLDNLWNGESGWNPHAQNPSSGAYGIPQALPPEKLASAGADWRDNPITQAKWGLSYIQSRYGTPCQAWQSWQSRNPHWY